MASKSKAKLKQLNRKDREETANAIYFTARKIADKELKAKNFSQSCREYLKGARLLEKNFSDSGILLCSLYAGAGNAARWQGKYALAFRYFDRAITYLKSNQDFFIELLQYIVDGLSDMSTWVRSEAQRNTVKKCARKLLRKFASTLKRPAPQSKATSYVMSGRRIQDRFSPLEVQSESTKSWLTRQALFTRIKLLSIVACYRKPKEFYKAAFAQMHRVPFRRGAFYFFSSNDKGGFMTIRMAVANNSKTSLTDKRPKIVFAAKKVGDNNSWLSGFRVNRSGDLLAYGLSKNGSDFETWRVRDLKTGKDLPDRITEVPAGSIRFHPSKRGLYYRRSSSAKSDTQEPTYTRGAPIYFHRLGDAPAKDKIIHLPNKADWVDLYPLNESKHVLISEWPKGKLQNCFSIKSLTTGNICPLFPRKSGYYSLLGEANGKLYIKTDNGAPKGRVLALIFDYHQLRVKSIEAAIKESQFTLQDVRLLQDRLIASTLDLEGRTRLLQFDLNGNELDEIELPFEGTLSSLSTNFKDTNIFFSLENFATAKTIYRHDLTSGATTLMYEPSYSMAKRVVQKMVQVKSKDGVMVPMNIAYLKGTKFNGNNGTILSVYGGFSIANLAHFSYQTATWLAMGGIWAQPYLRGGDELGALWHSAATKENKQRTYDDTISSAEWLIANKVARAKKIAIYGASNGGLTVGATITQRPDLFGAAISDNGLFDMLKFANHGLGWAWQSEYGSPENNREFEALRAYSPYHQIAKLKVKASDFPHLLINASAGDNRVVPWHSYKFAAACQQQRLNVLLNIKWDDGHGWGRPDWSVRDNLAYLQWALKMD
ncbi:MAG: prolyl oligopeptidase family serine peptidase [Candidatus Melainabacteria bacterium]|nr:prolyl oligopeptidase family serine peptidase [Candidatus Melainabacteria bacterium]